MCFACYWTVSLGHFTRPWSQGPVFWLRFFVALHRTLAQVTVSACKLRLQKRPKDERPKVSWKKKRSPLMIESIFESWRERKRNRKQEREKEKQKAREREKEKQKAREKERNRKQEREKKRNRKQERKRKRKRESVSLSKISIFFHSFSFIQLITFFFFPECLTTKLHLLLLCCLSASTSTWLTVLSLEHFHVFACFFLAQACTFTVLLSL